MAKELANKLVAVSVATAIAVIGAIVYATWSLSMTMHRMQNNTRDRFTRTDMVLWLKDLRNENPAISVPELAQDSGTLPAPGDW